MNQKSRRGKQEVKVIDRGVEINLVKEAVNSERYLKDEHSKSKGIGYL